MSNTIIDFRHENIMDPAPWPIGLQDSVVMSGLGKDDGATLIGFAKKDEQAVEYLADQIAEIDWDAEELVPVFSKRGKFFNWNIPVRGVRITEPVVTTDPVFSLTIRLAGAAMLTPNDIAGALEKLADAMRNHTAGDPYEEILEVPETTRISGVVIDNNGQIAGHWNIKEVAR